MHVAIPRLSPISIRIVIDIKPAQSIAASHMLVITMVIIPITIATKMLTFVTIISVSVANRTRSVRAVAVHDGRGCVVGLKFGSNQIQTTMKRRTFWYAERATHWNDRGLHSPNDHIII